jgi:hypothetical protein
MISVGTSQQTDTERAAAEGETPPLVLAFCGKRHQPDVFLRHLRACLDDAVIVGGAAVGTITHNALGYVGYECAIAAFPSKLAMPTTLAEYGLDQGETAAGRRLGERLLDITRPGDTVLLFYDSIRSSPPPVLNVGSRLMDGIYTGLDGRQLHLIGAGTVSDFQLTTSYVFDGRQTCRQAVVAVVFPSGWCSHTTIMHGCTPVSSFLEITRAKGPVIYELDGLSAMDALHDRLGVDHSALQPDNLSLALTLGRKHGDPFAPYDESLYVNRLIMSAGNDGSITLFEADFEEGEKVQIMARDSQKMLESVRQRTAQLLSSLGVAQPVFALYIDCAGRASAFSGCESEEASILQAELKPQIPLLGFYSGVEIAPLLGRSRPLDWTGVLTLFTLEDAGEFF